MDNLDSPELGNTWNCSRRSCTDRFTGLTSSLQTNPEIQPFYIRLHPGSSLMTASAGFADWEASLLLIIILKQASLRFSYVLTWQWHIPALLPTTTNRSLKTQNPRWCLHNLGRFFFPCATDAYSLLDPRHFIQHHRSQIFCALGTWQNFHPNLFVSMITFLRVSSLDSP